MAQLKFFVGTVNTLSVSLVDNNNNPITDADKVASTIYPADDVGGTVVWTGSLAHTSNGIYEATLPANTFDSYDGVRCVAQILAEEPLGTQIAYMDCYFTPQVKECSSEFSGGGYGDIGTMSQRVLEEVDKSRNLSQEVSLRAIISALEDYRWKPFFFNKFWFTWQMEAGTYEYGPSTAGAGWPLQMLWITYMQINDPVNGNLWWEVFPLSQVNLREWQNVRFSRSVPRYYKFMQEKIIVAPVPNRDYVIECDGIQDLGTPGCRFVDGRWNFYDPRDPARDLGMDFSSGFFTWGERLIRAAAKKKIYKDVMKSMEGFTMEQDTEDREFKALTENTEKRQVPRTERKSWGL